MGPHLGAYSDLNLGPYVDPKMGANIKSNMETNSLESHLSRIRKKINTIKSKVKIQTKNEKLLIMI